MNFYWLILGILGVWRITHLLNKEDGPWDLLVRFRKLFGNGFVGKLLDCFYCLSIWVSIPLGIWLGDGWKEKILMVLGFSAGAIILERLTSRPATAQFIEDEEISDDMLRQKEGTIPTKNGDSKEN
jgi:hypothetical protein